MVDFSAMLSPQAREALEKSRCEMARIYALPDRWLGEELLRLARRAREELPEALGSRDAQAGYDAALVWDVVPEISRRLGCRKLQADEGLWRGLREADGQMFRRYAGACLQNNSIAYWAERQKASCGAAALLSREVVNGNPVAIGVDRLYRASPVGLDQDDFIARQVREVSKLRGFAETAVWWPGMQVGPQRRYGREDREQKEKVEQERG